VAEAARRLGLVATGVSASPLRGPKGNREFFLRLEPASPADAGTLAAPDTTAALETTLAAALEAAWAGDVPGRVR
jgi:hypothetical protein